MRAFWKKWSHGDGTGFSFAADLPCSDSGFGRHATGHCHISTQRSKTSRTLTSALNIPQNAGTKPGCGMSARWRPEGSQSAAMPAALPFGLAGYEVAGTVGLLSST
jgi:hypothetical protein